MKGNFAWLGRFALTLFAIVAALAVGRALWVYYMDSPWTRDGRVRADVVQVAPDVSGFVTDVLVKDNQNVHRGDVLFRIDRARFALALQQADAISRRPSRYAGSGQCRPEALQCADDRAASQQKQEQVLATQLAGQGGLRSGGRRPRRRPAQPRSQRGTRFGKWHRSPIWICGRAHMSRQARA